MAKVTLKNLVKQYGSLKVVNELSLEVQDKEFAVLVGPSGCGKSTALRMIAGLESVSSGEIYIGDALVNDLEPKDRDIAMVFQNYALYPHMTVRENMGFGLKIRKLSQSEIDVRVQEASDILGLNELLDRKPKELSGGQRQRVAVGRAIVRKPKVFLFDEPLSNLDAKLRVAMRAEISKLHKRLGATMIYVTHDQVEAMTMADRIFIMSKAVLQQSGVPMEVYSQPANRFVAGFIGSPAMNFFDARIVSENGELFIDGASFKVAIPEVFRSNLEAHGAKDVVFGVRPEDISLHQPGSDDGNTITAKAEVVELLGSEIFVHLTCGAHALVARMAVPEHLICAGETIQIDFKMVKTHIFDKESSQTII
ncbi:sn-glycerol-3-phosphate ABC transporter ATP-binding protein UgpC [Rhodoferax sp.]|uniref:ABC transporter ATP-binding protein n=1 Tax=Rhodoferax sp. TaxID=50421 RepID=UPI0025D8CC4A|nr:sn-glycerol-3-phosphate ABC transporter ATP-binding protein UgpC [Rhodoferax sp.]MCM2297074.1 sn-glycerol-3-phosphate ABC transporter ATP-binding protein UgpC [Rhodoferax sp.]